MKMIDAKEAFLRAKSYFDDMFSDSQYFNVILEEIEMEEDGHFWLITLGYHEKKPFVDQLPAEISSPLAFSKKYKIFEISTKDGSVISMKIRTVD